MFDTESLRHTYDHFVVQGAPQAKALSNKNFAKLCKDCKVVDGGKVTTADVDIMFSKYKTHGQQTITFDQFITILKELGAKRFGPGDESKIYQLVADKAPQAPGTTRTSLTGGVEKMTDTSHYTGSHRERFGSDGKGLGIDGREQRAENSGYVGNYKGQGTYKNQ